jgi:hypothetical protein
VGVVRELWRHAAGDDHRDPLAARARRVDAVHAVVDEQQRAPGRLARLLDDRRDHGHVAVR